MHRAHRRGWRQTDAGMMEATCVASYVSCCATPAQYAAKRTPTDHRRRHRAPACVCAEIPEPHQNDRRKKCRVRTEHRAPCLRRPRSPVKGSSPVFVIWSAQRGTQRSRDDRPPWRRIRASSSPCSSREMTPLAKPGGETSARASRAQRRSPALRARFDEVEEVRRTNRRGRNPCSTAMTGYGRACVDLRFAASRVRICEAR